jgi:hypothetical protein
MHQSPKVNIIYINKICSYINSKDVREILIITRSSLSAADHRERRLVLTY